MTTTTMTTDTAPAPRPRTRPDRTRYRGFASLSPQERSRIASLGGRAAHRLGVAHTWTSEEAQQAGRKGGAISRKRRRAERDTPPHSLNH